MQKLQKQKVQHQTEQNEAETTVQQKSVMAGSSRTTHKAQIITNWLCECDDELAVLSHQISI